MIFTKRFPGGFVCEYRIDLHDTSMTWTPRAPGEKWDHWGAYYRWRNRCTGDYALAEGVMYMYQLDIPWRGVRGYTVICRDDAARARYARAQREGMLAASEYHSTPGTREELLARFERAILDGEQPQGGVQ